MVSDVTPDDGGNVALGCDFDVIGGDVTFCDEDDEADYDVMFSLVPGWSRSDADPSGDHHQTGT